MSQALKGRAIRWISLLAVMGMSPYCYREAFIDYHFVLGEHPRTSFMLPDTVTEGRYVLRRTSANDAPECDGLRPYDIRLRRSGYDDLGVNRVYVGFDHENPLLLHVVAHFDASHEDEPDAWATVVARMVLRDAGVQTPMSVPTKIELGGGQQLKGWCTGHSGVLDSLTR